MNIATKNKYLYISLNYNLDKIFTFLPLYFNDTILTKTVLFCL